MSPGWKEVGAKPGWRRPGPEYGGEPARRPEGQGGWGDWPGLFEPKGHNGDRPLTLDESESLGIWVEGGYV